MKTMKVFIAGQEVFSAPLDPSPDPPGAMLTTISNVRTGDGFMSFETAFGEFSQIPYSEQAFSILKDAELSCKMIKIGYSTK